MEAEPRLAFVHVDDVPWTEVIAQLHGERRVSVHEKFLEWTHKMMVVLGRYDPHVVIERHGHRSRRHWDQFAQNANVMKPVLPNWSCSAHHSSLLRMMPLSR